MNPFEICLLVLAGCVAIIILAFIIGAFYFWYSVSHEEPEFDKPKSFDDELGW